MTDSWLCFEPLDTMMFRDGRPFSAGSDTSGRTVWPRPSSVAGAVKAALGGRREDEPDWVAGPVLVTRVRERWESFWPCPRDIVDDRGRFRRLELSSEGQIVSDFDGLESFPVGQGESIDRWARSSAMTGYLRKDAAVLLAELDRPARAPHEEERRIGLWRESGRTAALGFLYAAQHLRLQDGFGLAARVAGSASPKLRLVRFGGESRLAEVSAVAGKEIPLPAMPNDFPDGRLLVYIATPAIFPDGSSFPVEDRAMVESACVEGPEPVATWDGSPNRWVTRWAVAAGSVYFLRFPSATAAREYAKKYHGRCLPQSQHQVADDRLRTAGFGMCLIGRW